MTHKWSKYSKVKASNPIREDPYSAVTSVLDRTGSGDADEKAMLKNGAG